MVTGALWLAVVPWKNKFPWVLFLTVTLQEAARFGLHEVFRLLQNLDDGVKSFIRPGTKNHVLTGLAVGTGFASLSVLVNFYTLLIDFDADDTAIYTDKCPSINFFVAASAFALAYSIMHIMLGVLVWPSYIERSWLIIILVYLLHLGIAEMSLGNLVQDGCRWTMALVFSFVAILSVASILVTRRRVLKSA